MFVAVLLAVSAGAQSTRDCSKRDRHLAACAVAAGTATTAAYLRKSNCDRDCNAITDSQERNSCLQSCDSALDADLLQISGAAAACVLVAPDCEDQSFQPQPIHPSGSCPYQYDADVCELAGGTWDHRNEECNGA